MKTYNNSVSLRNDGVDPSTSEKDLNAGVGINVTVRVASTPVAGQGALASIFNISDDAIANPLQTDNQGNYTFKAPDGLYDIVIAEGTADETILSSVEIVELITPDFINNLSLPYVFDTVAAYKAFTSTFPDGKQIKLLDRGATFTKISGIELANSFNIIANDNLSESIELNVGKEIITSQWIDVAADFQAVIPFMDALGKTIIIDIATSASTSTTIESNVEFTMEGSYSTLQVLPDPNVAVYKFNGIVTARRTEIFPGDGDIVLNGPMRVVYPEWFGIFSEIDGNDGSENLDSNTRRAGRCVGDSECAIEFGNGLYYIRDFLLDQSNSGMIGQGKDNTFIKNSPANAGSTRLGVFTSIFAPTDELPANLGNRNWTATATITDCYMKDFTVVWDDTGFPDPLMNGLAVLGVQGATIENIHASLPTGNRAFAVQTFNTDQKTEDILFTRCSSDGSLTGIYISEGFEPGFIRTGKTFKNIQVIDNHFSVRHVSSADAGIPGQSSPVLFHGGEDPEAIEAGVVTFKGNHCEGGAAGVYSTAPDSTDKFNSKVIIEGNGFINFREQGVISYVEDMEIINNTFDSTVMQTSTVQASGIALYGNAFGGALKNTIRGNTFKNISGTGAIYGVLIQKNLGCSHLIDDNWFRYDNGLSPNYDVFFLDNTGVLGDVKLSNNKFFDTGVANVRGTTVNQEMLYHDLGGNQKMNLFNSEVYDTRLSSPVDSRYYVRGETLKYGLAAFTAGTQVGYICTTTHTPLAVGTWKNIIG
tara:strand:- start:159 stop:2444 length:2286 start_codon:yes stop_codon:yes gene_type:complete